MSAGEQCEGITATDVMPSWTTGGTDVICEKEKDEGIESARDRGGRTERE